MTVSATCRAARRRLYFTERVIGGAQRLNVFDFDSFTPLEASPLEFEGMMAGELAVNPVTGDVFVVD